jgi:hypothetical protein
MTTHEEDPFEQIIDDTFDKIRYLSTTKGGEYATDDDRLSNFRRNAATLGLSKERVWAVYAAKHWDALLTYVNDMSSGYYNRPRSESPASRVDDLIVYLLLFKKMIFENDHINFYTASNSKTVSHINDDDVPF